MQTRPLDGVVVASFEHAVAVPYAARLLAGLGARVIKVERRDGGDFDAFTGATITPRAIVKAVRRSLEFYQINATRLFAPREPQ